MLSDVSCVCMRYLGHPARAAAQGVQRLAARPTAETRLKQVQRRKRATGTRVAAQETLTSRDADRR